MIWMSALLFLHVSTCIYIVLCVYRNIFVKIRYSLMICRITNAYQRMIFFYLWWDLVALFLFVKCIKQGIRYALLGANKQLIWVNLYYSTGDRVVRHDMRRQTRKGESGFVIWVWAHNVPRVYRIGPYGTMWAHSNHCIADVE